MAGSIRRVLVIGEHRGAGDRRAERHARTVGAAGGIAQIIGERERASRPCGRETVTGLLRRVQMRLVARIMSDARETVRTVRAEFRVGTLVRAIETVKQLHALELEAGLRVPTVEVVEAGHALERVGHLLAGVRVRELDGPRAAHAFRRVDPAHGLFDLRGQAGIAGTVGRVDPESSVADDVPVSIEPVQFADAAAVPVLQPHGHADLVGPAGRVGPLAHGRDGQRGAELQRPHALGRGIRGPVPRAVLELDLREPRVGGVEHELAVVAGDIIRFEVMHRQTGSGSVRHGPHGSRGLRLGLLDGVRGRVGRDLAGGILRVLVVGETVGDGRIDRLE